jgi:signal peptidase II
LAAAGASGNLVDRVLRKPIGGVVDFLKIPHWPNFNLADSYIFTAATIAVFLTFFSIPPTATEALK